MVYYTVAVGPFFSRRRNILLVMLGSNFFLSSCFLLDPPRPQLGHKMDSLVLGKVDRFPSRSKSISWYPSPGPASNTDFD
ncbi:hypothetical protein BDP27DRAFT_1317600 [Rhodocollybia butyracea]|uniref:Uncharacterized protein n=1 Tax=Rhodocollybia butyracea TaxID=206335 RepID=A0A9P5Q2H7_9AGAR|nr:hypothetical protein BDP27DRAFT_1317600 [Rhodocollybia butyracea]